ncbi:MAG: hypothetical protein WDO19_19955 [Bacteroidota bacterium]
MDWTQIYLSVNTLIPIIANKGFITSAVASSALLIYYLLMQKEADSCYLPGVMNKSVRNALLISSVVLAYLSGLLEIWYQFSTRIQNTDIYAVYLQLYSFAFALILLSVFKASQASALLTFLTYLFLLRFLCDKPEY